MNIYSHPYSKPFKINGYVVLRIKMDFERGVSTNQTNKQKPLGCYWGSFLSIVKKKKTTANHNFFADSSSFTFAMTMSA